MKRRAFARLRSAFLPALVAGIGIGSAGGASAEIHALAIGFDAYKGQALRGAVADANDIAGALRKRGVRDVVMMTDPRSRVSDFHRRWSEIVSRSRPGDLIVLSFAGHGVATPAKRLSRPTPYGSDKGFLFPSFDPDARPEEILRDEHLYDLFSDVAARGVRIIFVADACHAGSGIRDVDPRRGGGAPRFQSFDVSAESPADAAPQPVRAPRPPIPSVATITAQLEEKKIQEYPIDGRQRGILSYAVARGLEGAADAGRTGSITFRALWDFVKQVVEDRSENQQAPQKKVRAEDETMPIFGPEPGARPPVPDLPAAPEVVIHSLGSGAALRNARFMTSKAAADLIWDPQRRQLLDAAGDVLVSGLDGSGLQGAVDARHLLLFLRGASERSGNLNVSVRSATGGAAGADEKHRYFLKDERLVVETAPRPFPYTTLFNISASGEVQIIFPREDAEERPGRFDFEPLVVLEPFGGDFAVFVNSEAPLGLWRAFKGNKAGASEIEDVLTRALAGKRIRIGIQSLFTCRELKGNKTCDSMLSSAP